MIGALSDQKVLRFGGEAWRVLGLFLRCFVFEKISEGILLLCEVALAKYIIMGGCQCQEQVGSYPAPTLRLAGKPPYLNKIGDCRALFQTCGQFSACEEQTVESHGTPLD